MEYSCDSFDTGTCAAQYSFPTNVGFCPVPVPPTYPPLVQVPFSTVRVGYPNCKDVNGTSCPITLPYTGNNPALAASLVSAIIPTWADVSATVTANAKLAPLLAAYGNGSAAAVASAAFKVRLQIMA